MLLLAFILNSFVSLLIGAFIMRRFGMTHVKEKIVLVENLSPQARILVDGFERHKKKKHGGVFTDCSTFECWGARRRAEQFSERSEPQRDFATNPPPSLFGGAS